MLVKKGVSQFLLRKLTAPVDFVYVDGSHQAADVFEDAVLSFRLLNLGKTRSRKAHFFSRLQCATW